MFSFKAFNELLEADEDQINEVFGKFFGKDPKEQNDKRKALLNKHKEDLEKKKKEREDRNAKWADARQKAMSGRQTSRTDRDDYAIHRQFD